MVKSAVKATSRTPRSSQRIAKRLKLFPKGDIEGVKANSGVVSERITSSSSSIVLSLPALAVPTQSPLEDDDLLKEILSYVGEFQYRFIGGVNRIFRETYVSIFPKKETDFNASSIEITNFCWNEIDFEKPVFKDNYRHELWYSAIRHGKVAVVKYYLEVLLRSAEAQMRKKSMRGWHEIDLSYCEIFVEYKYIDGLDYRAAEHGNLELLQWACNENKGVNKTYYLTCVYALGNGHLALFDWAVENGFEWNPDDSWQEVAEIAAGRGKLEALKWIVKSEYDLADYHSYQVKYGLCTTAAEGGHLEVMKWLHENDCPWYDNTIGIAIINGHFKVVKYLVENDFELVHKNACHYAARTGNVAVLKFLRSMNCEWDHLVPAYAAAYGHIDFIEWAVNNGCPWSESACEYAAAHGELETLKWLHEKGCPWDENTTKYKNHEYSNDELYRWAVDNGCPVYQGRRQWEMDYCENSMDELLDVFLPIE